MIICQILYPVPEDNRETKWKSIDEVCEWGQQCGRKLLERSTNHCLIYNPNFELTPSEVLKYYEV